MRLKAALASHQAQAKRHALEAKSKERIAAQKSAKAGPRKKARPAGSSSSVTPAPSKAVSKVSVASAPSSIPANPATELSESIAPPAKRVKPTIPFDKLDTILLLGEANFSFARSLLAPPHNLSGHMICATSFDTQEVCFKKYSDAEDNVKVLKEGGVRVLFGVDAGDLPGSVVGKGKDRDREARESKDGRDMGYAGRKEHLRKDQGGRWSRVIFNFPHAGAGIKDQDRNIITNQHLLLRTLRCVHPILTTGPPPGPTKPHLKRKRSDDDDEDAEDEDNDADFEAETAELAEALGEDALMEMSNPAPTSFTAPNRRGTILFTLLDQNPYTLWNLPSLAKRPPQVCPGTNLTQPRYKLIRSFDFSPEVYEGYSHRRTLGFKEGLSKGANEEIMGRKGRAKTWEFARWEKEEETKKKVVKKVKGVKVPKGPGAKNPRGGRRVREA